MGTRGSARGSTRLHRDAGREPAWGSERSRPVSAGNGGPAAGPGEAETAEAGGGRTQGPSPPPVGLLCASGSAFMRLPRGFSSALGGACPRVELGMRPTRKHTHVPALTTEDPFQKPVGNAPSEVRGSVTVSVTSRVNWMSMFLKQVIY